MFPELMGRQIGNERVDLDLKSVSLSVSVGAGKIVVQSVGDEMNAYLVGFETLYSLLFLLLSQDDERATVFVKCKTHFGYWFLKTR